MTNPVDEWCSSREKRAAFGFFPGVARALKGDIRSGALQSLGGLGVVGALAGVQKGIAAITKHRDFREMLEHAPDVAEMQQQNPKLFNRHYDSMRAMAPGVASDPVVAATWMRRMSMSPESAGGMLLELRKMSPMGPTADLTLKSDRGEFNPQLAIKGLSY